MFLSSDRDEKTFDEYYAEMPWLALPYDKRDLKVRVPMIRCGGEPYSGWFEWLVRSNVIASSPGAIPGVITCVLGIKLGGCKFECVFFYLLLPFSPKLFSSTLLYPNLFSQHF